MTGPPTPPPSSTVELQDQARSIAQEKSTSAPETGARHEIYQNALGTMAQAIQKKDYASLVKITEKLDFTTVGDTQPSRLLVVLPLVLGHLVLNDTPAARYAFFRLSENLRALPLPQALLSLVIATINREHAKVYDEANNLLSLVGQPDLADQDLASIISSLLMAFLEAFRFRTFDLLSKAYTTLPLQLTSTYIGWEEDKVIAVAESHGWSYNPSTKIFSPQLTSPKVVTIESQRQECLTLETFHLVANSVAKLEI